MAIFGRAFPIRGITRNKFLRSANAYTLSVTTGTYTINGNAVGLAERHQLPVTTGTYTISGNAVALAIGHKLPVTSGAYTISGNPVTLTYVPATIIPATGTYQITGNPVTLTYVPVVSTSNFNSAGRSAWTYQIDPDFFKGKKKKVKAVVEEAEEVLSVCYSLPLLFPELRAPIGNLEASIERLAHANTTAQINDRVDQVTRLTKIIADMIEEDDEEILMLLAS